MLNAHQRYIYHTTLVSCCQLKQIYRAAAANIMHCQTHAWPDSADKIILLDFKGFTGVLQTTSGCAKMLLTEPPCYTWGTHHSKHTWSNARSSLGLFALPSLPCFGKLVFTLPPQLVRILFPVLVKDWPAPLLHQLPCNAPMLKTASCYPLLFLLYLTV